MLDNDGNHIERVREKRATLLSVMYDMYQAEGGIISHAIWLPKAGEKAGLPEWNDMWAAASYLSEKGMIETDGGGVTGRMTVHGIDLIERARAPLKEPEDKMAKSGNLVVNAPVTGGIQFNSSQSTQSISIVVTKVDESIEKLRVFVGQSVAGDLDKEDAVAALDRLQQLAKKEKSEDVLSRAKEKLEIVKGTLETVKAVYELAQPYLNILAAHFALSH